MSSKNTFDLTAHIAALQKENEKLREYEKLLDKAIKTDLGIGRNEVKNLIKSQGKKSPEMSGFEKHIRTYFGLSTAQDCSDFIKVFCNDSGRNFFNQTRNNMTQNTPNDPQNN